MNEIERLSKEIREAIKQQNMKRMDALIKEQAQAYSTAISDTLGGMNIVDQLAACIACQSYATLLYDRLDAPLQKIASLMIAKAKEQATVVIVSQECKEEGAS